LIHIKNIKRIIWLVIGENLGIREDDSLNIKQLVRNDLIICACYYEHKMYSFHKLIQNIDLIFGKVKDYN